MEIFSNLYLLLLCSLVIIGIGLILWKFKWEIVIVRGNSMYPTLKDGDYVLIDKKPKSIDIEDILVLTPPEGDSLVIKRLVRIGMFTHCWVEGDNKSYSYDSRHYGWIKGENIEGRVIRAWKKKM